MKITLNALKPRNPLARLGRLRHAGSHRTEGGAMRQQSMRALKRELDRMKHSP